MGELDPRIRAYFGKDEHPEQSWMLLHRDDRTWIERIVLAGAEDPGVLPNREYLKLGGDDQRRRVRALGDWYKAWPLVRTAQVQNIERHLAALPGAKPELDHELLDVPVVTGRPGTGKTFLIKREAVKALCRAAWDRRLDGNTQMNASTLVDMDWRPVIFHSTDGNPRVQAFFSHLCQEIGVPVGKDPQTAFRKAIQRHGIQTVFIDEVQMINFDGQHGMYLHNAVKSLQNMNLRVILAGHNVQQMLVKRKTAAQNATQTQSVARWAFLEMTRYPRETQTQITQWRALLRSFELRLRLSGHKTNECVFSEKFEQHLWVSTLGYMNSLAALITGVCLTASRTKTQKITTQIIDSVRLNQRVQKGRAQRLASWRSGLFDWATDISE